MTQRIAADSLLVLHLLFIGFVITGGLLVWRWRWTIVLHLPAVVWGALIEFQGWICPLTPWEQNLRLAAGETGYTGGFVEHYLVALIYPDGLTRLQQVLFGFLVIATNLIVYGILLYRLRRRSINGEADMRN